MARPKTKHRAVKPSSSRKKRLGFAYPLVIFLLLCSGVFLVAWTFNVSATDILVTGRIPGDPVTSPAVITSPADGTHFTAVPIDVSGTCPANAAYVEIFRNNFMGGSALCTGGSFSLSTDLFAGKNDLTAHSFNITDDEGPVSNPITVYYDVPVPPAPAQGGTSTPTSSGQPAPSSKNPLILRTSFVYKGYYVGDEVRWPLSISGGTAPYALNVDWGDGTNSIISRKDSGQFDITHTYKQTGTNDGSYIIKAQASDADSNYAYLQFFVIVNSNTNITGTGTIYTKPPPSLGGLRQWLWVAWPAYASVILMVITYKLGEREELIMLRKRGMLKRS